MDTSCRMLPTEVVAKILQHVPQQSRINSCSLVCHSWHTAAIAATKSIAAQLPQQKQLHSLELWLQQQGASLEVLSISSARHSEGNSHNNKITLPFQQLQHLKALTLESLAPTVVPGYLGSLPGCHLPGLTSLQLVNVHLHSNECAQLLMQLTSLRHLQLCSVNAASGHNEQFQVCMEHALGTLTLLTSLVFDSGKRWYDGSSWFGDDSMLKGLHNLTQLQQLQVKVTCLCPATLDKLPLSLTHLEFSVFDEKVAPTTTPRLTELTRLRHLAISGRGDEMSYDPQLLGSLRQLQHLELELCGIADEEGATALLAVLPQLDQLQHLSLAQSLFAHVRADQYTSLVSSTQLTHLDLTDCSMPANAVYHIFKTDRQYSRLQTFQIGLHGFDHGEFAADIYRTVCQGALGRLVSQCPNLRELCMWDTLCPEYGHDVTALKGLTNLSKLQITGDGVFDDSVRALVDSQLPALRDLELKAGISDSNFTGEGVLFLCQMTQLTRLCVESSEMDGCSKEFVNQAGLHLLREWIADELKDDSSVAKALLREECAEAYQRAEAAKEEVERLQQQLLLAHQEIERLKAAGRQVV